VTAATIAWDAPTRSRLSGTQGTQVEPVVLTQGTRSMERLGARLLSMSRALLVEGAERPIDAGSGAVEARYDDAWAARADVIDTAQRLSTRGPAETAAWRGYVLGRLGQMLIEGEGRDAYPDASVIGRAWAEISPLFGPRTPTPSVVPSDDNGIAFVWHKKGWDVEIEVNAVEASVWAHRRSDASNWYGSLAENRKRLVTLLNEMTSK